MLSDLFMGLTVDIPGQVGMKLVVCSVNKER